MLTRRAQHRRKLRVALLPATWRCALGCMLLRATPCRPGWGHAGSRTGCRLASCADSLPLVAWDLCGDGQHGFNLHLPLLRRTDMRRRLEGRLSNGSLLMWSTSIPGGSRRFPGVLASMICLAVRLDALCLRWRRWRGVSEVDFSVPRP